MLLWGSPVILFMFGEGERGEMSLHTTRTTHPSPSPPNPHTLPCVSFVLHARMQNMFFRGSSWWLSLHYLVELVQVVFAPLVDYVVFAPC